MLDGFSYGGVNSTTYNITCNREVHSLLPEQRKYIKELPFVDGYADFGVGGYGARIIPLDLYFDGDYAELRANRENIIAWLSSSAGAAKQLEFDDEDGKYYLAKVFQSVIFENAPDGKIGTVVFECNPPWQYDDGILLTPEVIAWNTADTIEDNQYIKTFTTNTGTIKFTNSGTQTVKPIIYLIGYFETSLLLELGSQQWQYNGSLAHDGIIIDCNAETVTLMSDGSNLFGNVDSTKDDFFALASGNLEIELTGSGIDSYPDSLTLIAQFDPQDLE